MTNIYVGNLDFSTHEDQLQTLFATYGAVKTVTAVTDRDTGQPRGFAFVEMTCCWGGATCYSRPERFGPRRARPHCQ